MPKSDAFPFKKIFVVHKRSVYQKYVVDDKDKDITKLVKKNHQSTRSITKAHDENTKWFDKIMKVIDDSGIEYKMDSRHKQNSGHDDSPYEPALKQQ